jgi:hypothetical protein
MNIQIITAYDENHRKLLDITREVYKKYSCLHGYSFSELEIKEFDRPQSWFKVKAILESMKSNSEYILWCDADSMILNPHYKIEQIVSDDKEFYLAQDNMGLNCGIMLIKNSPTMKSFFQTVDNLYDQYKEPHPWCGVWEQAAVWGLCSQNYLNILSKIRLLPQSFFNAYDRDDKPSHKNGHVNDKTFILHLPNTSNDNRMKILKKYFNQYYEKI